MAGTEIGERRLRIDSEEAPIALFAPDFAGLGREVLHVANLDGDRGLIARRSFHSALCDAVDFPLRAIIHDALTLDAAGLVIAHNHPSGDPSPSRADLMATRALVDLARPLGIRLHDHLIFAAGGALSLCALGLL
jgi:DNA repair protein RadC